MSRPNFIVIFGVSFGLFMGSIKILHATVIRGAILHGVVVSRSLDPCSGTPAIGTVCSSGALYAGQWNGHNYMTTPGGCTDWANSTTTFTPTCAGGTDTVTHAWAANDGRNPTAYGIITGASSTTDGKSNTTTLVAYADADEALYCSNNRFGGYSDWYLPAASLANDTNGEMYNVLYLNRAALGGLGSNHYWSSTEITTFNARYMAFFSGTQTTDTKSNSNNVRCIRRY